MKDPYKAGIWFWVGGLVYSVINMIMNLKNVAQNSVLLYNYEIAGIAVLAIIFNLVLMKRKKK
ncbi:MAG: hypothetical protein ABSG05_01320 [Candidatus Pacearchaeota archaeon]|jgi:hypothetical protein